MAQGHQKGRERGLGHICGGEVGTESMGQGGDPKTVDRPWVDRLVDWLTDRQVPLPRVGFSEERCVSAALWGRGDTLHVGTVHVGPVRQKPRSLNHWYPSGFP